MRQLGYLRLDDVPSRMTPRANRFRRFFGDTPLPASKVVSQGTIPAADTKSAFTAQIANLEPGGDGASLPNDSINDQAQLIQKDLNQYQQWTDSCGFADVHGPTCSGLNPFSSAKNSPCYSATFAACSQYDTGLICNPDYKLYSLPIRCLPQK